MGDVLFVPGVGTQPRGFHFIPSIVCFSKRCLFNQTSLSLSLSVSLLLFQPWSPFFPAACLSKFSNLRFPVRYLLRASSSTARVQLQEPSRSHRSTPAAMCTWKNTPTRGRHGHVHMLPVRPSSQPPPNYKLASGGDTCHSSRQT